LPKAAAARSNKNEANLTSSGAVTGVRDVTAGWGCKTVLRLL
jgi:hypothetical protein